MPLIILAQLTHIQPLSHQANRLARASTDFLISQTNETNPTDEASVLQSSQTLGNSTGQQFAAQTPNSMAYLTLGQNYPTNHQSYNADQYNSAEYAAQTPTPQRDSFQVQSNKLESNPMRTFTNSYGNQAPTFFPDRSQTQHSSVAIPGYSGSSYDTGSQNSTVNATSALYPLNQISNLTLQMLGELITRSRYRNNRTTPEVSLDALSRHQTRPTLNNPASLSLQAPVNFHNPSEYARWLLDWTRLKQQGSRQAYLFSPPLQIQDPYLAAGLQNTNRYANQQTSSNIYNTYMPYSESSLNPLSTMNHGRNVFDSYIDAGYKFPLAFDASRTPYTQGEAIRAHPPSTFGPSDHVGDPQYIQHHSINNQNHLDKITYHSTPFRPVIVNPGLVSPATQDNLSSPHPTTEVGTGLAQQPLTDVTTTLTVDDRGGAKQSGSSVHGQASKEANFASVGSSSNNLSEKLEYPSDNRDGNTEAQRESARNSSKTDPKKDASSHYVTKQSSETPRKPSNEASSDLSPGDSVSASTDSKPLNQSHSQSQTNGSIFGSRPSLLFDLYESEIDNQIRDALYRHSNPLLSNMVKLPSTTTSWYDRPPMSLLDDSLVDQSIMSWARPISAWQSAVTSLGNQPAASTISQANSGKFTDLSATDSLLAALNELPTFSASDLQPIFPPVESSLLGSESNIAEDSLEDPLATLYALNPSLASTQQANALKYLMSASNVKPQATASTTPAPSQSLANGNRLPAILLKLNSKPLSSLLSNPLALLTTNRPIRHHKASKKPYSGQTTSASNVKPTAVGGLSHLRYISPNSLLHHHFVGNAGYSHSPELAASFTPKYHTEGKQYALGHVSEPRLRSQELQNQRAILAALLSVQHHGLRPNKLLTAPSDPNPQLPRWAASSEPELTILDDFTQAQATQTAFTNSPGYEMSQVWKSLVSPYSWSRKQNTGLRSNQLSLPAAGVSTAYNIPSPSAQRSQEVGYAIKPVPSSNKKVLGGTNNQQAQLALSLLLGSQASSLVSNLNSEPAFKRSQPRLRIKILKIPIAVYDQPTRSAGSGSSIIAQRSSTGGTESAFSPTSYVFPPVLEPSQGTVKVKSIDRSLHLNGSLELVPQLETTFPVKSNSSFTIDGEILSLRKKPNDTQVRPSIKTSSSRKRRFRRLYEI